MKRAMETDRKTDIRQARSDVAEGRSRAAAGKARRRRERLAGIALSLLMLIVMGLHSETFGQG